MGAEKVPIYQVFFEMQLALCDRFNNLTPFKIRKEKVGEVFLLIKRLNQLPNKQKSKKNSEDIIRKPASDDWY